MEFVNLKLLSHPVNWAFVLVTLLLASIAYKVIHDAVTSSDGSPSIAPD
jgi:hypothetical protein